jgi:hypothetical protein
VRREFPADMPLGLGTSVFGIVRALRAHGLGVERVHSGWFGRDTDRAFERVAAHVRAGCPVPVCIDAGMLGGARGAAHWAIVTGIGADGVRLGNVAQAAPLPRGQFMRLWRCRMLPYGHNHAAVLAWR